MLYKRVEIDEDIPVVFVGVHVLRWRPELDEPTVGFVEAAVYTLDNALSDLAGVQLIDNTGTEADIARQEIVGILRKLAGVDNA